MSRKYKILSIVAVLVILAGTWVILVKRAIHQEVEFFVSEVLVHKVLVPLRLLPMRLQSGEAKIELASPFRGILFDEAIKAAVAEKKFVLVDFYTTWCEPCKQMDRDTWSNSEVYDQVRSRTIPMKIDAEKERAVAARYKVDAYPTVILLKPDGSVVDRWLGYRDPATFIASLKSALAGKPTWNPAERAIENAIRASGQGLTPCAAAPGTAAK